MGERPGFDRNESPGILRWNLWRKIPGKYPGGSNRGPGPRPGDYRRLTSVSGLTA